MRLIELQQSKTIYLDLDGVLADFDASVKKQTGKYPREQKDDEMWKAVQAVPHFYRHLNKMEGADKFFDRIKSIADGYDYDLKILTAIPRKSTMPSAGDDKMSWVKEHFGNIEVVLGPYSRDKWKHAHASDILIDDRKSNIDEWINKGNAYGILYKNAKQATDQLSNHLGDLYGK